MVHVPVERTSSGNSEFLILDLWNSMEGLNQFFGNPQVQEQAGRIFTRDPVVWAAAEGFTNYHLPAPFGKNERYVAIARGKVASVDQARSIHNKIVGSQMNKARRVATCPTRRIQTSPARIARGIRVSRDGCMDECCGDERLLPRPRICQKRSRSVCLAACDFNLDSSTRRLGRMVVRQSRKSFSYRSKILRTGRLFFSN